MPSEENFDAMGKEEQLSVLEQHAEEFKVELGGGESGKVDKLRKKIQELGVNEVRHLKPSRCPYATPVISEHSRRRVRFDCFRVT